MKITPPSTVLAFLDLETTHLNTSLGEIVEIGIIIIKDNRVLQVIDTKVKPEHLETAHPRAMEVNGYAKEKWEDAISQAECAEIVEKTLRGCVLIGHNVPFDIGFLRALMIKTDTRFDISASPFICTRDLAKQVFKQHFRRYRLDDMRDHFGWSFIGAHTALKDTEDCCKLFYKCISAPCPLDKSEVDKCEQLTDGITYT